MESHNVLGNGKAYPCSRISSAGRTVILVEPVEYFVLRFFRDANSCVRYGKGHFCFMQADRHSYSSAVIIEFNRVRKKVVEDLPQLSFVTVNQHRRLNRCILLVLYD
ncbi:MAG: hypothetical protein BWY09_02292 [Candidatus Hydrogenedentes bacterium ADurb.Bin179]|nr:MAG: hypothetical protein BWY09_02292 [Candidatus Hydrogenedentes bacterium ADurb.Bin179]